MFHEVLGKFGLELRLKKNLRAARLAERHATARERWRMLRDHEFGLVLDIGANAGQFALAIRAECPKARIYSFEPLPDVFEALVRATEHDPEVVAVQLGLGEVPATMMMNRSDFSPSSSLLPMGSLHKQEWPKSAGHTVVPVKVARLDDWFRENVPGYPGDLLVKMDVQGFELAVIGGGPETLRRARFVVAEVSFEELYDGQPLFADVHGAMSQLGFRFRGMIEQHFSQKSNRILFGDAIFENGSIQAE